MASGSQAVELYSSTETNSPTGGRICGSLQWQCTKILPLGLRESSCSFLLYSLHCLKSKCSERMQDLKQHEHALFLIGFETLKQAIPSGTDLKTQRFGIEGKKNVFNTQLHQVYKKNCWQLLCWKQGS